MAQVEKQAGRKNTHFSLSFWYNGPDKDLSGCLGFFSLSTGKIVISLVRFTKLKLSFSSLLILIGEVLVQFGEGYRKCDLEGIKCWWRRWRRWWWQWWHHGQGWLAFLHNFKVFFINLKFKLSAIINMTTLKTWYISKSHYF